MRQPWRTKVRTIFTALVWAMSLNILWLGGTAAGLFLFGAGPASVASSDVIQRRLQGEKFSQVQAFWGSYRRNFSRGNAAGISLIVIAATLVQGWMHYSVQLTFRAQLIASLVALVSLLFAGTVCYVFPMFSRGAASPVECFVGAARHALCRLPQTVLMLIATVGLGYISLNLPLDACFLSFSLWFLMVAWFSRNLSVGIENTAETMTATAQAEALRKSWALAR
ncbi:YesL family protein [Arthrobacter psychrolactophilus]